MNTTADEKKVTPFSGERHSAFGYLAEDNFDDVERLLREFLLGPGERRFTKVLAYEYNGYRPEVHTGLRFKEIKRSEDRAHLTIVDEKHVWGLDTKLPTQPGRDFAALDPLRDSYYLSFKYDELQIQLRTPEGKLAWWHIKRERVDADLCEAVAREFGCEPDDQACWDAAKAVNAE